MREHTHTGFVMFLFSGFSAIVLLHVLRAIATQLADNEATSGAGKALAAFALAD